MIKSFQMKLALLTTVVSGLVLLVFAGVFWHLVEDSHQQRLDRDLVGLAHQLLASGRHSLEDLHISSQKLAIYGEELEDAATLMVDSHQKVVFQSKSWPADLTSAALPEATHLENTKLPDHSHGHNSQESDHSLHSDHSNPILHSGDEMVEPEFKTVEIQGQQWRLVGLGSSQFTLHVALNLATAKANLNHVYNTLIFVGLLALLVSAVGAWLVARRALRPLLTLTERAEAITASALGQQIVDHGADLEFARLIQVFNAMLKRLDASFQQALRFSADASHELKTPLTIMQGEMETALQNAPSGSEIQRTFASQLDEIQRLNNLVAKLLLLSNADSGALNPAHERFDFAELVRRVCEDISLLDSELTVEYCPGNPDDHAIEIEGDQDLLRQVVQNLAVNAVRYNLPGGWIRCELEQTRDEVVFRVCNSSEPIPLDQHEKIFRRFYRVDEARTGDHAGLGLSLAQEITHVHGGRLELLASDASGTVFQLRLPLPFPENMSS